MKYDFYRQSRPRRVQRIINAQQTLYRRLLRGVAFSRALEIGPGYGGFAEFCRRRRLDYVGVEENEGLATDLVRQGHCVRHGSALHLPNDLGRFDLVFAAHVIEHLGTYRQVVEWCAQAKTGQRSR